MKIYSIDWELWVKDYLPVRWRKPKTIRFFMGLLTPIFYIYGMLRSTRTAQLYKATKQQHITHVEGVLNDNYDAGFRRIKILDTTEGFEPFELWQQIENKTVFVSQDSEIEPPLYLWDFEESEYGGVDFVVQIPFSVAVDRRDALMATLNNYKTPGSSVIIQDV